jgi:hypothetical protein
LSSGTPVDGPSKLPLPSLVPTAVTSSDEEFGALDSAATTAWITSGSWLTAISSGAVRIARVSSLILVRSLPASKGAASMHHMMKCERSWSNVMPLPTCSTAITSDLSEKITSKKRVLACVLTIRIVQTTRTSELSPGFIVVKVVED